MRILMTCDPELPVPPVLYGGVERLVNGLAEAYQRNGHEVFLLAHHQSSCSHVEKRFSWPALQSRGASNVIKNAFMLWRICRQLKPDVVHSFSRLLYMYPLFITTQTPFLQTYGRRISPKSTSLASLVAGEKLHFTSAAAHMLNHLKGYKHQFTPVYNFTAINYFTPDSSKKPDHLIFLGRIESIKGTKECIEVALATNTKLIIAGNIQPGHEEYFNACIQPHLHHPLIEYVGPVDDEQKRFYLQTARALLFPIKWEEPFGIVMVEAMACGVPVIGFRRGSVPEVVKHGQTGFIVDTVQEMIEALSQIDQIDRQRVREDCVNRFSQDAIAKQYLSVLSSLSDRSTHAHFKSIF